MDKSTELTTLNPKSTTQNRPQPRELDFKSFFRFAKPYFWDKLHAWRKALMVVSFCLLIASKLFSLFSSIRLKDVINELSEGNNAMILIFIFCFYQFMAQFCTNLQSAAFSFIETHVEALVSRDVYNHIINLSIQYHLTRETGKVLRCLQRGASSFSSVVRVIFFSLAPIFLQLIIVMTYLGSVYDWYLPLILLASICAYILFTYFTTEWRTKIRRSMNEKDNIFNTRATDALINIETVKYFNAEVHEKLRYSQAFDEYKQENVKVQASLSLLNIGQQFIISISTLACLVMMGNQIYNGERNVGDFVLLNSFIIQLYTPLNFLGTYYRMVRQALVDVEGVFQLLDEQNAVKDPEIPTVLEADAGAIEFQNVSFTYNEDIPMLKNVSFSLMKGQTLAIVGPSGAGKSTIVKLLYRFYDTSEGDILIDGISIKKITQKDLRSKIGIVPQDCSLFNDTIQYNIAYGGVSNEGFDIKNSRNAAEWAADKAQLTEFIQRQPQQFETVVGERGLRLSGGEKQRVAIARALLKRPNIICFDEATSSLDSTTEKEIQKSMKSASKQKTTIIIAHRLSTISESDMIVVLDQGEIVEMGNHQQLINANGLYWKLWQDQSREQE